MRTVKRDRGKLIRGIKIERETGRATGTERIKISAKDRKPI